MIFSRLIYFMLRGVELISSIVALGLVAHFFHETRYLRLSTAPRPRLLYGIIWTVITTIAALVLIIPRTYNFLHYPADFFLSVGLFALFGLLVSYDRNNLRCGSSYTTAGGVTVSAGASTTCTEWRAAEAFSGIAAICFFFSFLLGILVYHRLRRQTAVTREKHLIGGHSRV